MEHRLKLVVAYDGSAFWGSQRQAGRVTVQGALESALSEVAGRKMNAELAGRTDRGVHAAGQVASTEDARPDLGVAELHRALDVRLGDSLSIVGAERVPGTFHARHDARWREYRYRIWSGTRTPLLGSAAWHRRGELELEAMQQAATRLEGTHDFASFISGGEGVPWSDRQRMRYGTVRTVTQSSVHPVDAWWPSGGVQGRGFEIRVVADGFLPRMVRGFVGAVGEIGRGAREPEWIDELLREADRRVGPPTAPPRGLVLWRVGYGQDTP